MLKREDLEGKAIVLGGVQHTISFEHNIHNGMGDLLGEIDHAKLILKIEDTIPDRLLLQIVLHECYHAMVEQTGTKLTKVRGNDEGFADRFSYFFANVLYDNPWLLAAINSRGKYA